MGEEGMGGEVGVLPTAEQRAARPIMELWIEKWVAWSRELKQHCDKSSDDERNTPGTQREGGLCATGNVEWNRKGKGGGERGSNC